MLHIVHVWLRPGLGAAETEAFIDGMRSLREIEVVREFTIGRAAATESRDVVDNSFDFLLLLRFDDEVDQKTYQDHPIHLKFVADHKDKWTKVRVRDSRTFE